METNNQMIMVVIFNLQKIYIYINIIVNYLILFSILNYIKLQENK